MDLPPLLTNFVSSSPVEPASLLALALSLGLYPLEVLSFPVLSKSVFGFKLSFCKISFNDKVAVLSWFACNSSICSFVKFLNKVLYALKATVKAAFSALGFLLSDQFFSD